MSFAQLVFVIMILSAFATLLVGFGFVFLDIFKDAFSAFISKSNPKV